MDEKACRSDGCDRRATLRGLCRSHYVQEWRGRPLTMLRQVVTSPAPLVHNPSISGTMLVPLTGGYFAIVDEGDAEAVSAHAWHTDYHNHTRTLYAATNGKLPNGRQRRVKLHQFLWKRWGLPPTPQVDHENLNGLDCRRLNLRAASFADNQHNRGLQRNNTSGAKGVSWHKRLLKWQACIAFEGVQRSLGFYVNKDDAVAAYAKAAVKLHGSFARVALASV